MTLAARPRRLLPVTHHITTKSDTRTLVPPVALVLIAVCLTVTGELLLKHGMNQNGALHLGFATIVPDLFRVITNPFIFFGFGLIFSASIFWLSAISQMNLSVAYPMLSTSYVLILLASAVFLGETVTLVRWLGVGVILAGVGMVFWSSQ